MTPRATTAKPIHKLALLLLFGAVAAHSSVSIRRGRALGASLTRHPDATRPIAGTSAHFLGRPSGRGKSGRGKGGGHGGHGTGHHAHHAHGHDEEEESHSQNQSAIGEGFRRYWRELPILLALMLLSGVAICWGAWQLLKLHRQFQQAKATRNQRTERIQKKRSVRSEQRQAKAEAFREVDSAARLPMPLGLPMAFSSRSTSVRGSGESRVGISVRRSGGSTEAQDDWNFSSYLSYNISYWYVWSEGAPVKVICILFLVFYLAGTISYSFLLQKPALHSMYVNLCWLISPDAGSQENTRTGIVIGIAVSLGGLFIFALFLTSLFDIFQGFMDNLSAGRSLVMESGHTVVLGFNSCTPILLRELCEASGGEDLVIAVLAPDPKPDVEQQIRDAGLKFGKGGRCKIVVRSGSLHDPEKLKSVAVDLCKTVIIVRSEEVSSELRDAEAFRTLRLLRGNKWPYDNESRICLACPDMQHIQIYKDLDAKMVMMSNFIGQLMVKCSEEHGLGTAIKSLVSFEAPGAELYIVPAPEHLEDVEFSEAQLYFPEAVPVGFAPKQQNVHDVSCSTPKARSKQHIRLCPQGDRKIGKGDDIILLAESRPGTIASKSPEPRQDVNPELRSGRIVTEVRTRQEIVIIIGWSRQLATPMLEALNSSVSQGSEVIILSKEEPSAQESCLREECEKKREMREASDMAFSMSSTGVSDSNDWKSNLGNLDVHFQEGDPSSPQRLQTLVSGLKDKRGLVKRVFIIGDKSIDSGDADLVMINTTMHLKCIFKRHDFPDDIRIIPEVRDPSTADMLLRGDEWKDIFDFVASDQLEAEILATFACDNRIGSILDTISSADGVADFVFVSLQDVTSIPMSEISFFEASMLINSLGGVLVGWELEGDLFMNPPDKNSREQWVEGNKLLVLAPRSGTTSESISIPWNDP